MSQAGLLVWIIFVCFAGGVFVGRLLEQKRIGTLVLNDWDRLQLSFLLGTFVFMVEEAGHAKWLPYPSIVSNAVGLGYVITTGLISFFVFRLLRQSRTGAA